MTHEELKDSLKSASNVDERKDIIKKYFDDELARMNQDCKCPKVGAILAGIAIGVVNSMFKDVGIQ